MRIIDPGHAYNLNVYDGQRGDVAFLQFMKRMGEEYPGNVNAYAGTNCQEVLRVLVERVEYLNRQIPSTENLDILIDLRHALWCFEMRAAKRHGRILKADSSDIESVPHCLKCGHIECGGHK